MSILARRSTVFLAVGFLVFVGTSIAVVNAREPEDLHELDDVPVVVSDLAAGGELYRSLCAACHQSAGVGGALSYADNAPSLMQSNLLEVAVATRGGPGEMPAFSPATLSDIELAQIVTYVKFLQDPGAPGGAPIGSVGPVSEGAVLWFVGIGAMVLGLRWIGRRDD